MIEKEEKKFRNTLEQGLKKLAEKSGKRK